MGIIYKPNTLVHWAYSLYYILTFQKLWHVIDFIYFRRFYISVAKQIRIIPMMEKKAVVTKFSLLLKRNFFVNFVSVGESLGLFKRQLHFKQYIKTKRVRFGIKLYKLTSSNAIT